MGILIILSDFIQLNWILEIFEYIFTLIRKEFAGLNKDNRIQCNENNFGEEIKGC